MNKKEVQTYQQQLYKDLSTKEAWDAFSLLSIAAEKGEEEGRRDIAPLHYKFSR